MNPSESRILAEQAHQARAAGDLQAAANLLRRAIDLNPADLSLQVALDQVLQEQAAPPDPARDEFLSWCSSQARKLQAAGDLEGAAAILRQGLEQYPRQASLQFLLSDIEHSLAARQSSASRDQDLALLQRFIQRGDLVRQDKTASRVLQSLDEISQRHPADPEIQSLIARVRSHFIPQPAPPPEPQPLPFAPPPPPPATAAPPPPPPIAPPAARPAAPPSQPLPSKISQKPALRNILIAAGVLIVVLGVAAILRQTFFSPSADLVTVQLNTVPSGATIRIGGESRGASNLTLQLAPGEYHAEALLDGHEPYAAPFRVEAGKPLSLNFTLNRWRSTFRLFVEADQGQATFGDRPLTPGPAGDALIDGFNDGDYPFRYASANGEASAALRFAPSGLPLLAEPLAAKKFVVVLVHLRAAEAMVHTNMANARASLDGAEPVPVPPTGLAFSSLSPGEHRIAVDDGKIARTLTVQSGGGPSVNAYIFPPPTPDRGTLLVSAGVDGAEVFLNGRKHYQVTRKGMLRIGGLGPGNYEIRVAREGYESASPRRIDIKAGEEARLDFELKPIPRMATLQVSGPAGAQVLLDGNPIGELDSSGNLSAPVSPGAHSVELRRGAARSRAQSLNFSAGQTLTASGFTLTAPDGSVRFDVNPAEATLLLRKQGEPESAGRRVSGPSMNLAEGSYAVVASAPGYTSSQVIFAVQPGASSTVTLRLTRAAAEAPKAAPPAGIADFDEPSEWAAAPGGWYIRRGGNYSTFSRTPAAGTFAFTAQLRRGKRLQWFANYRDEKNHLLFRIDNKNFYRLSVVNGRTTELAKVEHGIPNANTWDIRLTISASAITHQIRRGGEWVNLDDWTNPGADPTAGKFGFYTPGGKFLSGADEYGLKDFQFVPRR